MKKKKYKSVIEMAEDLSDDPKYVKKLKKEIDKKDKRIENKVKRNSAYLDTKMKSLMKKHKNKYAVCHNKKIIITNDLEEALKIGYINFGIDSGFAARPITDKTPIIALNLCN